MRRAAKRVCAGKQKPYAGFSWDKKRLEAECSQRGLSVEGKKSDLRRRLRKDDSDNSSISKKISSGVFQRSISTDIEWHTLKFVGLHEVFALQAVSTSARDFVRRAFADFAWDVVFAHWSAELAYRSIAELCITKANIRSVSLAVGHHWYDENTLLEEAVRAHNLDLVRTLSSLESIDINSAENHNTLLHLIASWDVCTDVDVEIAKVILAHPDVDVNVRTSEMHMRCMPPRGGDTPLHVAIRRSNVELVKLLLEHKGVDVSVRNANGEDPLVLSTHMGCKEVVKLLLDHKDVDINSCRYPGSRMALQNAVLASGYADAPDIVRMLATHERLDVQTPIYSYSGSPVLVWAGTQQDPHLMKLLLEREDTDVNATNDDGRTALHDCLRCGHPKSVASSREVLKLLLSQSDIDLEARDRDGKTPADVAEEEGISKLYERLLPKANARRRNARG